MMPTLKPACSLFAISSLLLGLTVAAQTSPQVYNYHECGGTANSFESKSVFAANLDRVISTLSSLDHTHNGFYNLSVGKHADQVNSFALCRGDVGESSCLECIKFAATDLSQRRCPAQKDAVVWYDNCMLRYSTWYIFGSLRHSSATVPYGSYSSDARLYKDRLFTLLKDLRRTASLGGSHLKFAVGDVEVSAGKRIYALVQCLPNLDQMQCVNCVVHALRDINRIIPGMEGGSVFGASCNLKFDTKQFYGVTAAANLSPHQGRQKRNIIVVVAVSIICLILVTCFCLWRIKSKAKTAGNGDEVKSLELQVRLETIRAATSDFSDENKLGQGGFGAVYKGQLMDGPEIAVKRLSQNSSQGDAEFKNEVMLLAKLQHKNLVKLLGFCLQGQERLLIYEYVPNASLDKFLSDPFKRTSLNWDTRYKIIKGIARGLLYLHEDSRLRVIHRDLKTSNILLDADLNPKIADFGMARLFFMDQTHSETNRIVGTYGYMPPEYAIHGQFSTKSDVYSFGVIIVELITGHKISSFTVRGASENLTSFAWDSWRTGNVSDFVDPALMNCPRDEILRCIHIGLLCVQESVKARPTMASVNSMLSSITLSMPLPSRPAYFTSDTR